MSLCGFVLVRGQKKKRKEKSETKGRGNVSIEVKFPGISQRRLKFSENDFRKVRKNYLKKLELEKKICSNSELEEK